MMSPPTTAEIPIVKVIPKWSVPATLPRHSSADLSWRKVVDSTQFKPLAACEKNTSTRTIQPHSTTDTATTEIYTE